jgi:hypothetical protein
MGAARLGERTLPGRCCTPTRTQLYGPIISYNEGVDYFTVRLAADCGTHYMPESRKEKLRKSGHLDAGAPLKLPPYQARGGLLQL